jgi:small subunit ribosomal protein S6
VLVRFYETTFILNPQADDATLDQQIKNVAELITTGGGRVIREERMGTRRLAYMINGLTQGHYTSLVFEAPTVALTTLERHYRLEESIIRNLTVVFEGDPVVITEQSRTAAAQLLEKEEIARAERAAQRRERDDDRGYSRPQRRYHDEPRQSPAPPTGGSKSSGSDEQL